MLFIQLNLNFRVKVGLIIAFYSAVFVSFTVQDVFRP